MSKQITRIVCEGGLTLLPDGDSWWAMNGERGRRQKVDNVAEVLSTSGFQPVLITSRLNGRVMDDLVLPSDQSSFAAVVFGFSQSRLLLFQAGAKSLNMQYLLKATQYHCVRLCIQYSEICNLYSTNHPILMLESKGRNPDRVILFQGQPNPYFEFDALITCIRRTYDTLRYLLWQFFGPESGSMPSSFYKVLPQCQKIPTDLAELLSHSWDSFGKDITEYRDCIQHYCPLDFGMSSAHMKLCEIGVWTTEIMIPDNPSEKSRNKFVFLEKRDALAYGLKAAEEVLHVTEAVFRALPQDDPQAQSMEEAQQDAS